MPLFYHKYVNYVLAHSVNYVITLYRLAPPVAPILVVFANLCKRTPITCLACPSRCTDPLHSHNHCKRTTHPRLAPPHLPPLSKVRCCRPIKFGRRPEELQHLLRPFRFSDTSSVNNPSVTVTENVILHQHIFYFNIKQY